MLNTIAKAVSSKYIYVYWLAHMTPPYHKKVPEDLIMKVKFKSLTYKGYFREWNYRKGFIIYT